MFEIIFLSVFHGQTDQVGYDWCSMCKKNGGTVYHLLLQNQIGLGDALSVVDLACFIKLHDCSQVGMAWKMIPLCQMWCIWIKKNEQCFNDDLSTLSRKSEFFLCTLCCFVFQLQ